MRVLSVDYHHEGVYQFNKPITDLPDQELTRLINASDTTCRGDAFLTLQLSREIMQGIIRQRHGTVKTPG